MAARKKNPSEPTFEDRLGRLEQLVEELEGGELNLEDGVERYREGVELLQILQKSLSAAELKVEELTQMLRRSLDDEGAGQEGWEDGDGDA